jgi:SHS2 domain-containing protein
VHPVERPPYRLDVEHGVSRFEVDAADFAGLLAAAALALSDATRPLGRFDVWTARRVSVRGAGPSEVLERWLSTLLHDARESGFLPALIEVERAESARASGIHRGGIASEDAGPAERQFTAVVAGSVVVEPGGPGRPWRAKFDAR